MSMMTGKEMEYAQKMLAHYKRLLADIDTAFQNGVIPYDAWEEKSEQYEEAVGDYEALLRNLQTR